MARLFVIGNGYDIAHGFAKEGPHSDSSYEGFKEWLLEKYVKPNNQSFDENNISLTEYYTTLSYDLRKILDSQTIQKNVIYINEDEKRTDYNCAVFIVFLINKMSREKEENCWKTFEKSLELLDTKTLFQNIENRDIIARAIMHIQELFTEWVKSLKINNLKKNDYDLEVIKTLDKSDFVLSFNYTETIELLFEKDINILHIHGFRNDSDPLFAMGHENKMYKSLSDEIVSRVLCKLL